MGDSPAPAAREGGRLETFAARLSPDRQLLENEETALRKLESGRELEARDHFAGPSGSIDALTSLLERVLRTENDRETSLNSRGAAVTASAGILVALSGFVANTLLGSDKWSAGERYALASMFMVAVALLVTAAAIAVLFVLRPARGRRTWAFLGESVVRMVVADTELAFARADPVRLKLLGVDRALRQLPHWHFRNRRKARWLRRAYVILGLGIALIGATVALAVSRRLDIPYWAFGVSFGGAFAFSWVVIKFNLVLAERDDEPLVARYEDDESWAHDPVRLLEALPNPWEMSTTPADERGSAHGKRSAISAAVGGAAVLLLAGAWMLRLRRP